MLKFLAAVAVNIINHTNVNLFRELEIVGIRGEHLHPTVGSHGQKIFRVPNNDLGPGDISYS